MELDTAIKSLSVVAAAPELYPALIDAGAVTSLLGLLTHENTVSVILLRASAVWQLFMTLFMAATCDLHGGG